MSIKIIIMLKNNAQHLLNAYCSSDAVYIKSRNVHTKTHASSILQVEETGSMDM